MTSIYYWPLNKPLTYDEFNKFGSGEVYLTKEQMKTLIHNIQALTSEGILGISIYTTNGIIDFKYSRIVEIRLHVIEQFQKELNELLIT